MPSKKQSKKQAQRKQAQRKQTKTRQEKTLILLMSAVIIILLIIIVSSILQSNKIKSKIVCEEGDTDCLQDNCECVEKNLRFCPEGFELDGKLCRRGKDFTNSLLKCSKYSCNYTVEVNKIPE